MDALESIINLSEGAICQIFSRAFAEIILMGGPSNPNPHPAEADQDDALDDPCGEPGG